MKFTQSAEGRYVLGENSPPFSTIPEVIHYYTTHKLPIRGAEHMSLLYPVIVQTLWHWHTRILFLLVLLNMIYTRYIPTSAPFLHAFSLPFYLHCSQEIGLFGAILYIITPVTTLAAYEESSVAQEPPPVNWYCHWNPCILNTTDSWKSVIIHIKIGSWVLLGKRWKDKLSSWDVRIYSLLHGDLSLFTVLQRETVLPGHLKDNSGVFLLVYASHLVGWLFSQGSSYFHAVFIF